jgi:hypothetical protein
MKGSRSLALATIEILQTESSFGNPEHYYPNIEEIPDAMDISEAPASTLGDGLMIQRRLGHVDGPRRY